MTTTRCPRDNECGHCAAGRPTAHAGLEPAINLVSLFELDEDVRRALPPQYHLPEWIDCTPAGFFCRACWGDGWMTSWPCHVATAHGRTIATALGLLASY